VNQAVQIQDGFEVLEERMIIRLIVSGLIMHCHISGVGVNKMAAFYQDHQFDLEELINERVEEELWDENGVIHINADSICS
jgi:hypothetical protein|tara:strand:+ start:533 stop:775 length:243 start_codon:yes stop_codon:yes gene_type:complete